MATLDPRHGLIDVRPLSSMPWSPGAILGQLPSPCLLPAWRFCPTASASARRPTGLRRRALLGLLSEHQGLYPFETQLGFPQGKQQPKIKGQHLPEYPSILGSQGIRFESSQQRFTFFPTERDFFGSFHSALHPA
jgi:hypothetical protein